MKEQKPKVVPEQPLVPQLMAKLGERVIEQAFRDAGTNLESGNNPASRLLRRWSQVQRELKVQEKKAA